ncbi:LysM peptidoglycan-binding domain-containing protein [Gilvimarinus sp. F26214L]|uniref:LysM peptidoglycan-binding domain-containing protein n=1 Tax=Gilvimarinus sp. DZF01 TaxID=3461371 RepID=UPI00404582CB
MKKIFITIMALSMIAASAWGQEAILRDDHPTRYTVVKGDTLWDISGRFLENPWMWPEIWHVNPQISNPHLIYPGDVISLVYVDGQPRLIVERGDESRTYKVQPGTVKLSPSVRVTPLADAIPSIPLDAIDTFLSDSRIVTNEELDAAPYVIAGGRDRLIVGAGDFLYARGDFEEGVPNYGVYRRGDVYIDPFTDEVLGIQAQDIGTVRVRAVDGDIGTTAVTRTTQEIRVKDRLLPHEERPIDSSFMPSPPEGDVEGVILAVEEGVSQVGKMDVVILNRGVREGLQPGNVLAVYKKGALTRDPITNELVKLPEERAGLLMVFRSFEKLSFGLVLEAELPLATMDIVRNP